MITAVSWELHSLIAGLAIAYGLALIVSAVAIAALVGFVLNYLRLHGPRLVMCPQTNGPALIEIDALHAAASLLIGDQEGNRHLRILQCSRWMASRNCGHQCLKGGRC